MAPARPTALGRGDEIHAEEAGRDRADQSEDGHDREAQEHFHHLSDGPLEGLDRFGIADDQAVHRDGEFVGDRQHRSLVKVPYQKQQEILVAELGQQAVLETGEERIAVRADHRYRLARHDNAQVP
jgi:hypothetical protein